MASAPTRSLAQRSVAVPRATTATPIGALLHLMADGDTDAVPVLEYGRIVGIVTQTDLISALARETLRPERANQFPNPPAPAH